MKLLLTLICSFLIIASPTNVQLDFEKAIHENYEKYRRIIESITESDPNRKTKEDRAEKLEKQNREININATHEYNMIVLDKIQRKINKNLKHRRRKEAKSDGTYNECNDFITNIIANIIGNRLDPAYV